jgi:hypothetical protein
VPIPTFPPGIKAKLVVPPVWICFTPVVEEKFNTDEAPPIVTEVALGKDKVVLLIVAVPDEAPIFKVVAAPPKLMVEAVVFQRFWVDCVPTTVGLPMVKVPELAPIFKVVAALKALMVVAVVLKTLNEVESVTTEVEKVGEVPNTKRPEPVSSVTEAAILADEIEVVKLEEASVETNLLAVKPEKVIVPDEEMPVAPVIAPVPIISIEGVSRKLVNPPPPVLSMTMAEVTALLSALFK